MHVMKGCMITAGIALHNVDFPTTAAGWPRTCSEAGGSCLRVDSASLTVSSSQEVEGKPTGKDPVTPLGMQ